MEFPIQDKSNYLKGLLIVARKDNQLAEQEKDIIRGIADKLGFATDFYEETLKNLLLNKYINEEPPFFSNPKIAQSFILDGLKLAFADNHVSEKELEWLKKTAAVNSINEKWFEEQVNSFKSASNLVADANFALYSII